MDNNNLGQANSQSISENNLDFRDALSAYMKHWVWILISLILFTGYGYFYVRSQTPFYKIQTDILIKDNSQSSDKDILAQLNLNPNNVVIDNEIQIIKSTYLVERAVKNLNLNTVYYDKGHFRKRYFYKNEPIKAEIVKLFDKAYSVEWQIQIRNNRDVYFNRKKVALNKPVWTDAGLLLFKMPPTNHLTSQVFTVIFSKSFDIAQQYASSLVISSTSKLGSVLNISMEDAIPERGKDLLCQLVMEYNNAGIEDKNRNTANTLSFIEGRLKSLVVELTESERKVQDYKSINKIANISTQAQQFLVSLGNNDEELNKIQLQLSILDNIEEYLVIKEKTKVKLPSLLGMEDETVSSLVSQLGQAQLKRESLLRTVPETNPIVSSINDQIVTLKETLNQTIQNVRSGLLANKRHLALQSKAYEASISQVPKQERGLLDVMRQQDIRNNLFTYLLQKREETAMALAATVPDSRIINPSVSSGFPIRPIKSKLYLTFFLIGLTIPLGVIFISEALNNKIRSKADIQKITNLSVLAQISLSIDKDPIPTVANPRSMVAEQIRALRTNLEFIVSERKCKIILFTSSISGEGKSFTALNLGASLATTGKKVIVLELDMRKPKLMTTLGLKTNVGLSDYLIGKIEYEQIIREVPQQENFNIIESGTIPPNPAELLVNSRLEKLISNLQQHYDYILIDAPPVGLVTDAQILSKYADATLLLARFNYTKKQNIYMLNELYVKKAFNNMNIVFNSLESSAFGYGYDYGYYQEEKGDSLTFYNRVLRRLFN